MKKGLLFLLSLILVLQATAQRKDYFLIRQVALGDAHDYPEFYHKRAKKAAKNINEYLQLAVSKRTIEAGADSSGAYNLVYTIPVNNQRMLSVSCPTPQDTARHFLFNAATGALISIQDIFTANGIAYLKRQLLRRYREQLKNNGREFKQEGQEKCIKADIQEFQLTTDSLIIFPGYCFTIDTSGKIPALPYKAGFSIAFLSQYLSEYGKVILGVNKQPKLKKLHSVSVAGLYRGKIDQEEVLLQLNAPIEKSLSGTLYFTQSKKSIPFGGSFKNNRLDIPNLAERLSLTVYPGSVSGQRKAGNKVLSNFTLTRQ
ncbi:MAG: hypothetical protein EOP54_08590 [Sphingobacteriales bacterium]|nr:MAG: hypothetical protein EOP54_08590 [Sphingobacteriales bacterium]